MSHNLQDRLEWERREKLAQEDPQAFSELREKEALEVCDWCSVDAIREAIHEEVMYKPGVTERFSQLMKQKDYVEVGRFFDQIVRGYQTEQIYKQYQ